MEINVKWLMEQTECENFHCVSNEADINLPIRGVRIIENLSTFEWLKEGDFILTTGCLYKDNTRALLQAMQILAEGKCSGIGMNMKHFLDNISQDAIIKANELKLPLVAIPDSLSLAEVSSMICRGIFINTPDGMKKIYREYSDLAKMIMEEKDISNVIDTLSEYLDKQVILTDENWNIYSRNYSGRKTYQFTFGKQLWKKCNREDLKLLFLNEDLKAANTFFQINNTRFNCIVWKMTANQEIIGYMVIPEEKEGLTTFQYALIENLLPLLSFGFYKTKELEKAIIHLNNDIGYDFVNNFLLKDFTNIADIRSRCELYNFDFSKSRICILLKVKEEAKDIEEGYRIVRSLWNKYCEKNDFYPYIIRYLDNIIVYILDLQNQNEKERYETGKLLIAQVFQKLSELDICVNAGVSNYCMGYLSITRAFKQAEEAIHIGSKVEAEKRLFYYKDYFLYYMLLKTISKSELEEIYEGSWKVIDEFDKKNHKNFAETLEAYINCNMNAAEAAEKLYIHRNTMLYRMEKIRDLLKIEKFDGEQNLFLHIGLAAKRILSEII